MKKLTKANCNKYGIEIAPQFDFTDDGNRFRGFIYKGIPMTQCFSDNVCYLCIRVDYLDNNFTYKEWMQTDEYRFCDKFNGVSEFNINELIDALEKIILKVDEMNRSAKISEEEIDDLKNRIMNEVEEIENFIEDVKCDFVWWEVTSTYKLNKISEYTRTLIKKAREGRKIIETIYEMSIKMQKMYAERANVLGAKFYIEQIKEMI